LITLFSVSKIVCRVNDNSFGQEVKQCVEKTFKFSKFKISYYTPFIYACISNNDKQESNF